MSNLKISAAVATNIGKVRTNNEDNYFFGGRYLRGEENVHSGSDSFLGEVPAFFCAVFDGMGGEECGEVSAELAASSFSDIFRDLSEASGEQTESRLKEFYNIANEKVHRLSNEINAATGCTAAILAIAGSNAVISNMGDSKVYHISPGQNSIEQLSEDHTLSALMVKSGVMTKEEAEKSRGNHSLLRYIGAESEEYDLEPYISESMKLAGTDDNIFLLCSDGLTDMVSEPDILAAFSFEDDCKKISASLIDKALANGGRDNCTVIVVKVYSALD